MCLSVRVRSKVLIDTWITFRCFSCILNSVEKYSYNTYVLLFNVYWYCYHPILSSKYVVMAILVRVGVKFAVGGGKAVGFKRASRQLESGRGSDRDSAAGHYRVSRVKIAFPAVRCDGARERSVPSTARVTRRAPRAHKPHVYPTHPSGRTHPAPARAALPPGTTDSRATNHLSLIAYHFWKTLRLSLVCHRSRLIIEESVLTAAPVAMRSKAVARRLHAQGKCFFYYFVLVGKLLLFVVQTKSYCICKCRKWSAIQYMKMRSRYV